MELVHSIIDFQPTIRKIKIDKFLKRKASVTTFTKYLLTIENDPKDVAFDTLLLTELMYLQSNNKDNLDFYGTSTVQRLIDIQFSKTKKLMSSLFVVYLIGFCIPLSVHIVVNKLYMKEEFEKGNSKNTDLSSALTLIMLVTQVFFLLLEIAELRYAGFWNYFSDMFNIPGLFQFFVFIVYIIFAFFAHKDAGKEMNSKKKGP